MVGSAHPTYRPQVRQNYLCWKLFGGQCLFHISGRREWQPPEL